MTTIHIPTLMRDLTGEREVVELPLPVPSVSVREVLAKLDARYPGIAERLLHEGELMPGLAVFVDGEQSALGLRTRVSDENQIDFVASVAGG